MTDTTGTTDRPDDDSDWLRETGRILFARSLKTLHSYARAGVYDPWEPIDDDWRVMAGVVAQRFGLRPGEGPGPVTWIDTLAHRLGKGEERVLPEDWARLEPVLAFIDQYAAGSEEEADEDAGPRGEAGETGPFFDAQGEFADPDSGLPPRESESPWGPGDDPREP